MKNYATFALFVLASSILLADQFTYICNNKENFITFSESNGKALFTYDNNEGDVLCLSGDEFTVRKSAKILQVSGPILNHPRFFGFNVSFPIIESTSGTVTANVRFTNPAGMPLYNASLECGVERVQD